ncbi:hypothetical protein HYC85_002369 [Camellia sinensis]|uniref:Uncharacterized protein n=1 Tax=Camellia sinensis TaxID=4442 RepID=A0A7J7I807_CAMSI|nr:hypothetical protein HYC85_002369 [Camellia sinensis]
MLGIQAGSQGHLDFLVQKIKNVQSILKNRQEVKKFSWVTVFKQRASRLAALNERLIGIKVGDFWGVESDSEDTIKASAVALGKHGFINYFGLQIKAAAKRIYVDIGLKQCGKSYKFRWAPSFL